VNSIVQQAKKEVNLHPDSTAIRHRRPVIPSPSTINVNSKIMIVKNSLNNPSTSATTGENNYSSVSSEYHLPQIKSNRSNIPELNRSKIGTGAGRDDLLAENPLFN
jgi:hypothetical protein